MTADKPLGHDYLQCVAHQPAVPEIIHTEHCARCGKPKADHEPRMECGHCGGKRYSAEPGTVLRGVRYHMGCAVVVAENARQEAEECKGWKAAVEVQRAEIQRLQESERRLRMDFRDIDEASGRARMGTAPSLVDHIKALAARVEAAEKRAADYKLAHKHAEADVSRLEAEAMEKHTALMDLVFKVKIATGEASTILAVDAALRKVMEAEIKKAKDTARREAISEAVGTVRLHWGSCNELVARLNELVSK